MPICLLANQSSSHARLLNIKGYCNDDYQRYSGCRLFASFAIEAGVRSCDLDAWERKQNLAGNLESEESQEKLRLMFEPGFDACSKRPEVGTRKRKGYPIGPSHLPILLDQGQHFDSRQQ